MAETVELLRVNIELSRANLAGDAGGFGAKFEVASRISTLDTLFVVKEAADHAKEAARSVVRGFSDVNTRIQGSRVESFCEGQGKRAVRQVIAAHEKGCS